MMTTAYKLPVAVLILTSNVTISFES